MIITTTGCGKFATLIATSLLVLCSAHTANSQTLIDDLLAGGQSFQQETGPADDPFDDVRPQQSGSRIQETEAQKPAPPPETSIDEIPQQTGEKFPTPAAPAADQQDMDVMMRGQLHEAFAEVYQSDPRGGPIVNRQPPEPIEELPPEYKPDGNNVSWIPGYWAWDEDKTDFMWVSGVWRDAPPNQRWVPGYWQRVGSGSQWVAGFWTAADQQQLGYLPEPPASVDIGPSSQAASAEHFYVPGCWIYQNGSYVWQPGYWAPRQENWVWIPSRYIWTPSGCIFRRGFWDYEFDQRGVAFAPVYYNRPIYQTAGYSYTPDSVIDINYDFMAHLFLRPNCNSYYFGNWYGPNYLSRNYYPWVGSYLSFGFYDPLYSYYSYSGYRYRNYSLIGYVHNRHRYYYNNHAYRPHHTYKHYGQGGGTHAGNLPGRARYGHNYSEYIKRSESRREHYKRDQRQRSVARNSVESIRNQGNRRREFESQRRTTQQVAGNRAGGNNRSATVQPYRRDLQAQGQSARANTTNERNRQNQKRAARDPGSVNNRSATVQPYRRDLQAQGQSARANTTNERNRQNQKRAARNPGSVNNRSAAVQPYRRDLQAQGQSGRSNATLDRNRQNQPRTAGNRASGIRPNGSVNNPYVQRRQNPQQRDNAARSLRAQSGANGSEAMKRVQQMDQSRRKAQSSARSPQTSRNRSTADLMPRVQQPRVQQPRVQQPRTQQPRGRSNVQQLPRVTNYRPPAQSRGNSFSPRSGSTNSARTPSYRRPATTPSYRRPATTPSYRRPATTPSYRQPATAPRTARSNPGSSTRTSKSLSGGKRGQSVSGGGRSGGGSRASSSRGGGGSRAGASGSRGGGNRGEGQGKKGRGKK